MKRLALIFTLFMLGVSGFTPTGVSAATPPHQLWNACPVGSGAGQCFAPLGIAANPTNGRLYIADPANSRVVEMTAWGQFIRAWGWGVRTGANEFQICTEETTCREGLGGVGAGQFEAVNGIAIADDGDVFVVDRRNLRVQKFDPEGHFLLAFGGEVNKTTNANVCTAASGDTCGKGVEGTAAGFFSGWETGSFIAIDPSDTVYVGDKERVQEFDTSGNFAKNILILGKTVQSLAVDGSGNLYAAFVGSFGHSTANVLKLGPAGELKCTAKVREPRGLATDAAEDLFVVDGEKGTEAAPLVVRKFTSACAEVSDGTFPFSDGFDVSIGIATNTVTEAGKVGLYLSNVAAGGSNNFVRAYFPPPDRASFDPPPVVPPTIAAQYATGVGGNEATLRAKVNPHFWPDTRYYVQYGTGKCSEGGCTKEQPLAPGSLLSKEVVDKEIEATALLQGLEAHTTYHYRFIAESSGGGPVRGVGGTLGADGEEASFTTFPPALPPQGSCPNQSLRTAFSPKLPDCRAYEMVSPVDKNGGDTGVERFFPAKDHQLSSTDGNRLAFTSLTPFAGAKGGPLINQYLSQRGEGGWSTRAISPRRGTEGQFYTPGGLVNEVKAFSPDLCSAWLVPDSALEFAPGAPPLAPSIYKRDECAQSPYELLTTIAPPGFDYRTEGVAESGYQPDPLGFSADGSHTVFRANAKLTENACASPERVYQVYEANPEGGALRLISMLPPQGSSQKATCVDSSAGMFAGGQHDFRRANVYHAVSEDGSRVFWSSSATYRAGPLYVRLNATEAPSKVVSGHCTELEKACTEAISESEEAYFWGADSAGTHALYTVGKELREFDVDVGESQKIAGEVRGVAGFSEDLSRVYFVSGEVLSGTQENSAGQKANVGQENLYLYERGAGFTFVATLSGRDTITRKATEHPAPSPIASDPAARSARTSPDGLHLVFTSTAQTGGYDNEDAKAEVPDAEIYLYDVEAGGAGQLHCVSCNPSGSRPVGRLVYSVEGANIRAAAEIPGWPDQFRPSQLLSTDGGRFFFQSYDALVPADSNGRRDVYEWERAEGRGQCEEAGAELYVASAGGCLSLISSGQGKTDSEVIDASDGGRDVFFATDSSLLSRDLGQTDAYDARVNGGFPESVPPPPACEGEACQSPSIPPNDPTPASATFQGAGNLVEVAKPKQHKKAKKHKKHTHRRHSSNRKAAR